MMLRRVRLPVALLLLATVGSACQTTSEPASSRAGRPFQVSDAWLRSASAGGTTAAYMRIENLGKEPDRLVTARSPWARECRLQETRIVEGYSRLSPLEDGLPLPPGQVVDLKPGGPHIMLLGLRRGLEPGDRVPLTLRFAKAAELSLQVPVRQPLEADEPGR